MTPRLEDARAVIDSPLGPIAITERDGAIVRLSWPAPPGEASSRRSPSSTPLLRAASAQLAAYFAGDRAAFDVPLTPTAGAFEARVLSIMSRIPFGETRTYGDIAAEMRTAAQPVGRACGANPIPILIPCHRVLAADGLGGFSASGGIEDKVWLLRHEGAASLLL